MQLEEAEERRAGFPRARFEFGVKLNTDVKRVAFQFEDLAPLTGFILADKHQPCLFNSFDEIGIDFVPMTMALINRLTWTVEVANLRALGLPQGGAASQAHGATEVGFGNFWHEHDGSVLGVVFELG